MRAGTQVPKVLTAILMSNLKRSRELREHQVECEPTPLSPHRQSKLHTWLHQKHGQQAEESYPPLVNAGEAAPETSNLVLGSQQQQREGNWKVSRYEA